MKTNELNSAKSIWYSLAILLLGCLLSFWPLTFHVFSLKNDALNYFLPVRHQISELIYNGYWPFWSPYFNLGYPLHGDMQSGAWNPIVLAFSLFGPYTLRMLQYETLLYVYLSGVGMFFLVNYFFKDWRISLLIGSAFMLCGFNIDSTQFLNWISAASFLPFIFLFYYRTLIERNWKTALCCGLFLYLSFVTAYPADFILTCYLLFFVLVWFLFNRTTKTLRSLLALHTILVISFLLASLPAIISYAEFLPLTERGTGTSYADVISNSLHPGLLISYLTPLPVWKAGFASLTDPLERNSFFGLIPFSMFLMGLFIKFNEPITRFLKWAFIVSLLFSFGELGVIRSVAYYALPLMNTFRHPANERLFTIFLACLIASFSFRNLLKGTLEQKIKRSVWYALLLIFCVLLIWSVAGFSFEAGVVKSVDQLKSLIDKMTFSNLLLINVVIQIPFLAGVYFWLIQKTWWKPLLAAALFNSCLHAVLFQPFTVVKKDQATKIQNVLDKVSVKGYPPPSLNVSLQDNSKNGMDYFNEIGTSNMYNKRIGRVDYRITPSNLLTQNHFWFNRKVRNGIFQYPIFYKADTLVNSLPHFDSDYITAKKIIYTNEVCDQNIGQQTTYNTVLRNYSPMRWEMEVDCNSSGYYCLFQNYYPRWQLNIDGRRSKLKPCNISFIGFQLSAGKHLVVLEYKTLDLKVAFIISVLSFLVILYLVFSKKMLSTQK